MFERIWKSAIFALGFLLFWIFTVEAKTLEDLYQDFSPLSALVISIEGTEIILDKGRADGVHPGDLFTVYKQGKKIVHPTTKKVLGFLKIPVGKAEVTHTYENFATARILEAKENIKVGFPAIRFADQKVLIVETVSGAALELLPLLKAKLPDLHFEIAKEIHFEELSPVYLARQGIDLVFVTDGRRVRVYNRRLEILQIYGLAGVLGGPEGAPPTKPQVVPSGPPTSQPPQTPPPPKPQTPRPSQVPKGYYVPPPPPPPVPAAPPAAPQPQVQSRYPYSTLTYQQPVAPSFRKVGHLSEVVIDLEVGDADRDGAPEIVYLTPTTLYITKYRAPGAWRYEYRGFGKVLNFSLGPKGWIALNVYVEGEGMRSLLLRFYQGRFEEIVKDANFILGFFDFDADGVKETLLAQSFDKDNFFGLPVYEVHPGAGGKLVYQRKIEVPLHFQILGAAFADVDGDGQREVLFLNRAKKIQIYKGRKKIWESNRKVGGSIYSISFSAGSKHLNYKMAISAEVDPIVYDLNADGVQEVLLVANKSTHRDLIPGIPAYESGGVLVLTRSVMGFSLLPLTGTFDGPLQGISIVGQEIFVTYVRGNPFTQKGESYLLAFPLRMPQASPGAQIPYRPTP